MLSLLGGVRKNVGSLSKVPVRGDIHVLLVGDPGLGKSQLLQARPRETQGLKGGTATAMGTAERGSS